MVTGQDIIIIELAFMLVIDGFVAYQTYAHWGIRKYTDGAFPHNIHNKKNPQ